MIWLSSQSSREKKLIEHNYIITESCIPNGLVITVSVCMYVPPTQTPSVEVYHCYDPAPCRRVMGA